MIYVASSWRNVHQPIVVHALRKLGHAVYDFRNPEHGNNGFGWQEVMPNYVPGGKQHPVEFRVGLQSPIAKAAYALDIAALRACEACVYVLPCGRSASWELGYAMGQGKRGYVVAFEDTEPELTFMEAQILTSWTELEEAFQVKR